MSRTVCAAPAVVLLARASHLFACCRGCCMSPEALSEQLLPLLRCDGAPPLIVGPVPVAAASGQRCQSALQCAPRPRLSHAASVSTPVKCAQPTSSSSSSSRARQAATCSCSHSASCSTASATLMMHKGAAAHLSSCSMDSSRSPSGTSSGSGSAEPPACTQQQQQQRNSMLLRSSGAARTIPAPMEVKLSS